MTGTVEAAIGAYFDRGEYDRAAVYEIGRGEQSIAALVLLRRWRDGVLDLAQLRRAVRPIWRFHNPSVRSVAPDDWLEMFRAVPDEPRPPAPVTAWRGASIERGGVGMAWTLSGVAGAWDFALRRTEPDNEHPAVFQTEIPPGAVLAVIGGGEEEIVADPYLLDAERIIRCKS